MTILARVTEDLDSARGPDVVARIEVPEDWVNAGASVALDLPRLVTCARCEGGGCDACGRKGAFERDTLGMSRELVVTLPRPSGAGESVAPTLRLRLPGYGAPDPRDPALPPGHLLLTVVPRATEDGWAPSAQLRRLEPPPKPRPDLRRAGIWAAAVALVTLLAWWFFY